MLDKDYAAVVSEMDAMVAILRERHSIDALVVLFTIHQCDQTFEMRKLYGNALACERLIEKVYEDYFESGPEAEAEAEDEDE